MPVPFQGEDRHALVERLVSLYDEVDTEGSRPRWVALEAPSGWGKTRIVQELYAALVATRPGRPEAPGGYWPPTIVPADGTDGDAGIHATRKRVHPRQVDREGGSLPPFLWWGISCSARNGVASVALREDLGQLQAHAPFLLARCLQLDPVTGELRRSGRDLLGLAADQLGGSLEEAALGAATSALNIAVPGVGLVWSIGKWGFGRVRERTEQARMVSASSSIDTGAADDVLADAVTTLRSLARPGLPLVIAVEDLQLADATLVALLEELLASASPVLVVTTSWPGSLDEDALAPAVRAAGDRLLRVRATVADDAGDLAPLDAAARGRIVSAIHPGATPATVALLVERFENPLLLELACTLGWVREEVDPATGRLELTAEDVAEIPADAAGLYASMWNRLSEPARRALALAVAAIPHEVYPRVGANRWLAGPLAAAVREVFPQAPEVAAELAGTIPGWTRPVRDTFSAYLEPLAQRTAADHGHLNRASRVKAVQDSLFEHARTQLTEAPVDELLDLHAADLVIAWQLAGLAEDPVLFAIAVIQHTNALGAHTDDAHRTVELAEQALGLLRATPDVARLRTEIVLARAHALSNLGRATEAAEAYGQVAEQLTLLDGADSRAVLQARQDQASVLSRAGMLEGTLDLLEALVQDAQRALGPSDPLTLSCRQVLGVTLARSGLVREALDHDRELLELFLTSYGADHELTLAARNNIAVGLATRGYPDLAVRELEEVVATRTRVFGADHHLTLFVRGNLASELRRAGRTQEARTQRAALLADQHRVMGPDHEDTLDSAMRLARLDAELGRPEAALDAATHVVADWVRLHGDDDVRTARARRQLAAVLGAAGQVEPALEQARRAHATQVGALGEHAPDALDTVALIGLLLIGDERLAEAHPVYEELYRARLALAGPDEPSTLEARFGMLLTAPGADDAEVRGEMSLEYARALGPDHPDTLQMRSEHLRLLVAADRLDEAAAVGRVLVPELTQALGALHPDTRAAGLDLARALMASEDGSDEALPLLAALHEAGDELGLRTDPDVLEVRAYRGVALMGEDRWPQAVGVLSSLVQDRRALAPEGDPMTRTLRFHLAVALLRSGSADPGVAVFEALCDDEQQLRGEEGEKLTDLAASLEAWAELADTLVAEGRLAEAEVAVASLVRVTDRAHGPDAADTQAARAEHERVRAMRDATTQG
jgi:tetratricopeptide (TPR) repeat protein